MKFIKDYKLYLLEILFLALLCLVPLLWFKPGHVVIGVDSGYPVDYKQYFQQRVFTWLGSQNFGVDMSAEVGVMPFSGLTAAISTLGFSQFDVQKVLFVFWFLLIVFSIYIFLLYFFPKKEQWVIRISGTIIYSFSFHLYSFWLQGEQPILASYVILPLFSLFLLRFIQGNSSALKTAIYLNIIYFLFSSGGVRGIPLIGPIIVTSIVITAYYFIINFKIEGFNYLKRFFILSILSLIFLALCNSYFLYPFISSFLLQYSNQVAITGGITGAIDWAKFISTHTSFTNLFRLHGDNSWYSLPHLWANEFLTNPLLIIISFLFPVLAFLSPILSGKKERKFLILFLFIALFGLFFSAGAHLPLGYIYIFMMEHIPGFAAFRSGYYKFMPIVYFAFAVLVGHGIYYVINKFPKNISKILGILAITIILFYHHPYFTGANFDFNKPFSTMVKIPNYVNEFANLQKNTPDLFRTLVLPPPAGAFNIKTYDWGYWNSYPLFPLISDRGFVVNDAFVYNENENRMINLLYESLRNKDFKSFINGVNNTNIKYVLLTKDVVKDFAMSLSEDPLKYSDILKDQNNFKLIWEKGPWQLYEIVFAKPNKIEVFDSVVKKTNDQSSIDNALYTNSIPFVGSADISVVKNIPIRADLVDYPCVSCVLLDDDPGPVLNSQSINPNSFLYRFKLGQEKNDLNNLNSSQTIDTLLGLSRKRVSELDFLNYVAPESEQKWLIASNLLYSYWKHIRSLYQKEFTNSFDYSLLRRISQYLILEQNTLINITKIRGYDNKNILGNSLFKTIEEMKKVNKDLDPRLNNRDWKSNFVYNVSNSNDKIFINQASLPRDLQNNPIFPVTYEIDGVLYQYNLDQEFINVPKNIKTLTLTFNLSNLYLNPKSIVLDYNNEIKNCFVAPIANYSGLSNYIISLNVKDIDKGIIHIKRDYKIFKTADYNDLNKNPNLFSPDKSSETYTAGTGLYKYKFKGEPNDANAKIYFCSNKSQNPENVFSNISVTQEFLPKIYSYIEKPIVISSKPQIAFNKINSVNYKVVVKNATQPFVLSFSERYSPLWESKIKGNNINTHFMINGFGNGWYVDKKGSYNMELIFSTQNKFEKGLIVTLISVCALILYILINLIKKIKK